MSVFGSARTAAIRVCVSAKCWRAASHAAWVVSVSGGKLPAAISSFVGFCPVAARLSHDSRQKIMCSTICQIECRPLETPGADEGCHAASCGDSSIDLDHAAAHTPP